MTWKGTTFGITFDPSIDYDKNGNFYYALGGAPLSGNYPNSIAYSSDGGTTWTSPIKVDDGKTQFERVIGAYPAVDHRDGTVYFSWHNYSKNKIFVDRSINGRATWGTDVAAATTHTGFGIDLGCVGGRRQSPAHHLKVGPSGALHLVYADNVSGRGDDRTLPPS